MNDKLSLPVSVEPSSGMVLLTYIIYQQGLVTPRIAAGINLNFWPAGPIFRKAGAFFIRRSFRGNRMYSTIFREYLGLLFKQVIHCTNLNITVCAMPSITIVLEDMSWHKIILY